MNNNKYAITGKTSAHKRSSKSLSNGLESSFFNEHKDKDEQQIKTEENEKDNNNIKCIVSHQRNKSTQRLGTTSKESIMQRLMEAKRKKMLFHQKQEVLNGKRSEIDKELKEEIEEVIEEKKEEEKEKESTKIESVNNDDVEDKGECKESNNENQQQVQINNEPCNSSNNNVIINNNNIQIKEEVTLEISSHREQIGKCNNDNTNSDDNDNNSNNNNNIEPIRIEKDIQFSKSNEDTSNDHNDNTKVNIIDQKDIFQDDNQNTNEILLTNNVKEILSEEKKQIEESHLAELKKREERKRREEERQAEESHLKEEMQRKEALKLKKLEEKLNNKTPKQPVKQNYTYSTTTNKQNQPYRKAYHSNKLNQTIRKPQSNVKASTQQKKNESEQNENSKHSAYGVSTNLITASIPRMSPKPTNALTNNNNQNNNFNSRLTYHKPNNKSIVHKMSAPITMIYSPKKAGMRSCSNDRTLIYSSNNVVGNCNNCNCNININNIATYSVHQKHQNEFNKKNAFSNTSNSSSKRNRPIMSDLCLFNQRSYDDSPQGMKGQNYNIAMVKKIIDSPDKDNKNINNNNITNDSDINSNQLQINLQDLLIMEEKLRDILSALRIGKSIKNECFEWWNYFFHCTLYINLEQLFKDEHSKSILQKSIKVQLLTLLISYDSSIDAYLFSQIQEVLYSMLQCNHFNWGTICEYILSKIAIDNYDNPWVEKLRTIVIKNQNRNQHNNLIYIERIEYNTDSIYNDIRVILKYYQNGNSKTKILMNIYKSIEKISYSDLNKLFQEKFMQVENANASVLASVVLRENSHFKTVPAPYIKTKSLKQYTLVLDLDETIMHFKVNPDNELEGVLRVRPGIYDFLDQLSKYYEMIIFTAATQDYADILIDSIEETKIYFEYRLYRQHAVIIDNDFVKDLTRIGRSLDKVVIVDNMPQNFRLQQDNGIIIKPFWGEDINDSALYELMPILMNIAIEGGDIRNGLARYRDDIIRKVSSNLSRQSFDFC